MVFVLKPALGGQMVQPQIRRTLKRSSDAIDR